MTSATPTITPVVTATLMLAALYALGSYATSRLTLLLGCGLTGRGVFYFLVAPGVVLHESAHLAACVVTRTPVSRFAPLSPRKLGDGRLMLGRVEHSRRTAIVEAFIGLAPMVVNPLGVAATTYLLTPLGAAEIFAAGPEPGSGPGGTSGVRELTLGGLGVALQGAAAQGGGGGALLWAYLAGSFALGAVPSQEDLASVPAATAVVVLAGLVLAAAGLEPLAAAGDLAGGLCRVYTLPAVVAGLAALGALVTELVLKHRAQN